MKLNELYRKDEHQWCEAVIAAIDAGKPFDLSSVRQLLVEMSRKEHHQLVSRLAQLMTHLLKREFQPTLATKSWDRSINHQVVQLGALLLVAPSLKSAINGYLPRAYDLAARRASKETGLPLKLFPASPTIKLGKLLAGEPGWWQ